MATPVDNANSQNKSDLDISRDTLSALETLRIGASHVYYSIRKSLHLDKVAALLQRAELTLDTPVALLGRVYTPRGGENVDVDEQAARKILSRLVHHFHSTLWMTYRTDFPPLPAGDTILLKTDAGWGCTLRSVQMIAAQALLRHILGPEWRWPIHTNTIQAGAAVPTPPTTMAEGGAVLQKQPPEDLAPIIRLFWDTPEAPLSIHNLCIYGSSSGYVYFSTVALVFLYCFIIHKTIQYNTVYSLDDG